MPGSSRSLPGRPNLRYLRLEAKRRLAAGEFVTLHDTQTAIAREHGQPSWAALKQLVQAGPDGQQEDGQQEDGHALAQMRWVISRFSGADHNPTRLYAEATPEIPDLVTVMGPVIGCSGPRAIRIRDNRTHLVQTSRLIPVNSIDVALRGAWTNPEE